MAHDVKFSIPSCPVGVADIGFTVRRNGRKFGELRISKGTVVWMPADASYGRRLSWLQIDRLARDHGKKHKPSF